MASLKGSGSDSVTRSLLFVQFIPKVTVQLHVYTQTQKTNIVCVPKYGKKSFFKTAPSDLLSLPTGNKHHSSTWNNRNYLFGSIAVKCSSESAESTYSSEDSVPDVRSQCEETKQQTESEEQKNQTSEITTDHISGTRPPTGGGDGSNDGSGDNDENNEDNKDLNGVPHTSNETDVGKNERRFGIRAADFIMNQLNLLFKYLRSIFFSIFEDVPVPVVATIISAAATILATRIKSAQDERAAEKLREQNYIDAKIKNDEKLRASYQELTLPLLKSSAKLADRLFQLIDGELNMVENTHSTLEHEPSQSGKTNNSINQSVAEPNSALYSTYLLARFFSAVEIMKNIHPLFDYGFPAADRILHNIVGRIQGVLCANDNILNYMQVTELFFQSGRTLSGGLLKITPREQTVLGELLWKKTWIDKYSFIKDGNSALSTLTFLEFLQIYQKDPLMKLWTDQIKRDFQKMELKVNGSGREKRRNNETGARVFFLQSALCDLIDFFDPLPNTRAVSRLRRRRLQIDPDGSGVAQRLPMSLSILFDEIASFRDSRSVYGEDLSQRMKLPGKVQVEAYVTSDTVEDVQERSLFGRLNIKVQKKVLRSPCALSHQVLIALTEMSIPYNTVPISPHATPRWYYFMHPDNMTPVIYHHGQVFDDLEHVLLHLNKQFPKKANLASTNNLKIRPSVVALTKFHKTFMRWMQGENKEKPVLESELISLDQIISKVQIINDGKPFFGGNKFSYEDIQLAPFLHHIDIVGGHIKEWKIPVECIALKKYLSMARERTSFMKTVPTDEEVVEFYTRLISKGYLCHDRLADLLE